MLRLTGIFRRLTKDHHAIFQKVFEEKETDEKLKSANARFASGYVQVSELLDLEPTIIAEPDNWRKPYSEREFTIKIPPKKREIVRTWKDGLELVIWGKAAPYKFEKDKVEYHGWNITLKKFEKTSIVNV